MQFLRRLTSSRGIPISLLVVCSSSNGSSSNSIINTTSSSSITHNKPCYCTSSTALAPKKKNNSSSNSTSKRKSNTTIIKSRRSSKSNKNKSSNSSSKESRSSKGSNSSKFGSSTRRNVSTSSSVAKQRRSSKNINSKSKQKRQSRQAEHKQQIVNTNQGTNASYNYNNDNKNNSIDVVENNISSIGAISSKVDVDNNNNNNSNNINNNNDDNADSIDNSIADDAASSGSIGAISSKVDVDNNNNNDSDKNSSNSLAALEAAIEAASAAVKRRQADVEAIQDFFLTGKRPSMPHDADRMTQLLWQEKVWVKNDLRDAENRLRDAENRLRHAKNRLRDAENRLRDAKNDADRKRDEEAKRYVRWNDEAASSIPRDFFGYTKHMLNNADVPASKHLQGRKDVIDDIVNFFDKFACTGKPRAVRLLSTRGSGKTQLVKYLLFLKYQHLCPSAVMLVECSKGKLYYSLLEAVEKKGDQCDAGDVRRFTVGLIASHMRYFVKGGRAVADELVKGDTDVVTACRAWHRLCNVPYCIMVFDTVEKLPKLTVCKRTGKQEECRSFIEQLAHKLPSSVCVLFTGTDSGATRFDPTDVTGTTMYPLRPLTFEGYLKARQQVWEVTFKFRKAENAEVWDRLLYALGGGLPRLMVMIDQAFADKSDAKRSEALIQLKRTTTSLVNHDYSKANYIGLLMAGTAHVAISSDPHVHTLESKVPFLAGERYIDLCQGLLVAGHADESLFSVHSQKLTCQYPNEPYRFFVPPLSAVALLEAGEKQQMALPPLPTHFNPVMMFLPWRRDLSDFGASAPNERGKPFERVVANALVARDYLLRLNAPAATTITMQQLLSTDSYDVLKKLDVDLSGGLCFGPTAVKDNSNYDQVGDYYPGYKYLDDNEEKKKRPADRYREYVKDLFSEKNAHVRNQLRVSTYKYASHDMNILATWNEDHQLPSGKHYKKGDCCYIALQLRHGWPKTGWDLLTQVGDPLKVDVLLVVLQKAPNSQRLSWEFKEDRHEARIANKPIIEQLERDRMLLMIDASRFCNTWMPYLMSPPKPNQM